MRVLFLWAPVENPKYAPTNLAKFEETGLNTGNLAIGHSLAGQLNYTEYAAAPWPDRFDFGPEEASEKFDIIVIPAANFLFHRFDFGPYAAFIERTRLPCFMVGLGAQAATADSFDFDIPHGTIRFLSIVAERSRSIGVRGEFSAEVMARLGFKNVSIVGCPSIYRNCRPRISVPKKMRSVDDEIRVLVNGSRNVFRHSFDPDAAKRVERDLIEYSIRNGAYFVIQNEQPELEIVSNEIDDFNRIKLDMAVIADELELLSSCRNWMSHVERQYRVFFDIDSWSEFIRGFDFSIGSRLHGTILALTSGVPACLIRHDTRTMEMSDLFKIPSVMPAEIQDLNVRNIYKNIDFSEFEERYRSMYIEYEDFLTANGLDHKIKLPLWTRIRRAAGLARSGPSP